MKVPERKTSKVLRITNAVLYLVELYLLTCSYVGEVIDGENKYFTAFDLIIGMAGSGMGDKYRNLAVLSSVFLIFPVIGFFIFIFDRERNIKNIYGIVSSIIEVVCICFLIGPQYLQPGSMAAMFIYLVIFFLSMLGIFSRFVSEDDKNKPTRKKY
ncbi:MAG: hypothetical protein ACI4QE_00795 [Acutalibacteraceae bacterium]